MDYFCPMAALIDDELQQVPDKIEQNAKSLTRYLGKEILTAPTESLQIYQKKRKILVTKIFEVNLVLVVSDGTVHSHITLSETGARQSRPRASNYRPAFTKHGQCFFMGIYFFWRTPDGILYVGVHKMPTKHDGVCIYCNLMRDVA
jgi:Sec7-like guanine-nucleotide exchange factor